MYDILVLGLMYPPDTEKEIIEKSRTSTLQFAANAHFKLLIDGVEKVTGQGVKILNILPVGSYPKRYADSFIKEYGFVYGKSEDNVNVGYCNVTLIKQLSKPYNLKKAARKWAEEKNGRKKIVLVYTAETELLTAAEMLKKICDCHICQIVTDLPDYTDIDKGDSFIYKLATRYRVKAVEKRIKCADSFVFLTEAMADYFKTDKPYIVMEGLVPSASDERNEICKADERVIAYTGSLTKKYGIMDLVNAFLKIDKENYRLIICGSGEAEADIRAIADERIDFIGAVTHDEAKKLQKSARLLVNPRNAEEEFTKYSFPSKIMEYMTAGRLVLCFKLAGMPDEYDEYLNYFDTSDSDKMAEKIVSICERSDEELDDMGKRAMRFVRENKNEYVQAERMMKMIKECIGD